MNAETFARLQRLRMETTEAGYALDELRPRFQALANREPTRAVSAYQLFQTPPHLAKNLVALLGLQAGERVLEPSAGLGRILDALPVSTLSEAVAVEMAAACAAELFRQNRENVRLLQRDFLTCSPSELGTFDAVAMNPPFHMRSDIRHIEHAFSFVRPGGRVAAFMLDTPHREILRSRASVWEKIPAGAFSSEGTRVATILALFHK